VTLPKVLIEQPPTEPLPFGVLSAALVRDSTDPHEGGGIEWEPDFCGPAHTTREACFVQTGSWSISVDDTGLATITASAPIYTPQGTYTIDWGDGDSDEDIDSGSLDSTTHQYAAPGDYTVTVTRTDPAVGVVSQPGTVTVTNAVATGPFTVPFTFRPKKDTDDGRPLVTSIDFAVYHLSRCRLVGQTDPEAYARKALTLGESRAIEDQIVFALSSDDDLILVDGDAPYGPVHALARLEQTISENYNGVGVIYMDRDTATHLLASMALRVDGQMLRTLLGTRVVAASGMYGFAPEAGGGSQYMWATGALVVARQPINTYPQAMTRPYTNEALTLAERPISAAWECFAAAVQVVLPETDDGIAP